MIVSHADADHSGGALSVLDAVPVSWLISTLNNDHPIQQIPVNKRQCLAGETWQWDGVRFELLHPLANSYENPGRATNASSCVLKITTDHGSVLLPADIGKQSEHALLARAGDALPSAVLIAPHHGSNTSSTAEFINQVSPELTIFTVGYRNCYGHPTEEAME